MVNWITSVTTKKYILFIFAIVGIGYLGYLRKNVTSKDQFHHEKSNVDDIYKDNFDSQDKFIYSNEDLSLLDKLVYNRVPKCGSATTSRLIIRLAEMNKFKVIFVLKTGPKNLNKTGQLEIIEKTRTAAKPWIYIQHFHMINFTDYGDDMPLHINLIRDPIERKMSAYYYLRFKAPRKMTKERRNMTFDECIKTRDFECTSPKKIFAIVPYFCGSNPKCAEPTLWSLNMAKRNVEKYYSVIGYMEEIEKFYYMLEKTLPQYFNGLQEIYKENVALLKEVTSNKHPKVITEMSRRYLKSKLGYEYDFYSFIKKRFQDHYAKTFQEQYAKPYKDFIY